MDISLKAMNINALTVDGPAPVAIVYNPHMRTVAAERITLAVLELPATDKEYFTMTYMIPR